MHEIAAHQPPRLVAVPGAGLVIRSRDLAQPAEGHRRGERRDDQAATEPGGELDRRPRERGDIGRYRLLHRLRRDRDIVEPVMPSVMRQRRVARPTAGGRSPCPPRRSPGCPRTRRRTARIRGGRSRGRRRNRRGRRDSRSSVAHCSATRIGWCSGSTVTAGARRMRLGPRRDMRQHQIGAGQARRAC